MGRLSELSRGRNNNLDIMRLIAAVFVIYSHAFPLCIGNYNGEFMIKLTNNKMTFGSLAVYIFFIISGFLITKSYESSNNIIKYTKARFLRIWPAVFVVVVLSVFVIGPMCSALSVSEYFRDTNTWNYLKNSFMNFKYSGLPGVFETHLNPSINGSLWTITYEIACYILVAVIGISGLLKRKEISILLSVIFTYTYYQRDQIFANDMLFFSAEFLKQFVYLGMFFAAGMIYYCYREYIEITIPGFLTAVVGLVLGFKYGEPNIAFSLFGTYIIMFIAFNGKIVYNGLSKYGDLSYGIYIWAFPVQQIYVSLFKGDMEPHLNFILSLITVIPIAYISWHLIEKRCMKLKDRKLIQKQEERG